MKDFVLRISVLFCAVAAFCSCGWEEFPESRLSQQEIPIEIQKDFFARNGGNVRVTDAYGTAVGSAVIYFEDPAGHPCQSEYQDGVWQLTLREFDRQAPGYDLPRAVADAFKALGFERYCPKSDDDRVAEFSRRGIGHKYYEFRFHTELGPDLYALHFVLIDEEGIVLENANSYFNRMDWSTGHDGALDFIAGRYPGCDVRGLANDSGYDTFYIFHDGRLKRVRFQNNYQGNGYSAADGWRETVWQLDDSLAVPEYVWEEFRARMAKNPESDRYEVSAVYYLETPRGDCFGLQGRVSATTLVTNWFAVRDES